MRAQFDHLKITEQLFGILYLIIPLAILSAILKSAWFKGVWGEFQVNWMLNNRLPFRHYKLLKNVTLPTGDGSTQIDHIIVSRFGVFVIETKNMKGWIFGSAKGRVWTQKIFRHSTKFQNPLHQNYKHVKTLESALGISENFIHSVVVFVGTAEFRTEMPENVTYVSGCIDFIKSKREKVFTPKEVKAIVNAIRSQRFKKGRKTNAEHIAHVHAVVQSKKQALAENRCPSCGAEMVIRKARNGPNAGNEFWGCSAFPKCRTTAQMD